MASVRDLVSAELSTKEINPGVYLYFVTIVILLLLLHYYVG